ncbi:uracil-xanthine permease family protein [Opitutia bacterium ISCC 51]|nr:uracil-xanthine permease family protein [Opitutae bacterium ISCC 51]QXD29880.1 uracil-xanthine permease family protein [Opitutae bacterium ISCC 52]
MTEPEPTKNAAPRTILFGLNDVLPAPKAFLAAMQQVLAMFVGTITPPTIVASALEMPFEQKAYLISMSLLCSGLGTLVQVAAFGRIGSGLLSMTGTSFAFVTPLIHAGEIGGLPLMFGMALLLSPVEVILAIFLPKLKKIITPLVTGIVVLLIGLLLIPTTIYGLIPSDGSSFHPITNLAIAAGVLLVVLGFSSIQIPWARMSAALLALLSGYLICMFLGLVQIPETHSSWIAIPVPFKYGLAFDWTLILPFAFIYMVTTIESVGDFTACSEISGEPTSGPLYWKRIRGGVMADGINSAVAACLNCFPNTTFSQNNGIIQLTGIASRQVGFYAGGILIFFGLVPGIGNWLASVPPPVMSGLTILLFGLIATAGIRILVRTPLDNRSITILAVSLGVGVIVGFDSNVLAPLPDAVERIFSSGITSGGVTAIVLNAVLTKPK